MKDIFGEEVEVGDLILSIGSGRWVTVKAGDYLGDRRMTVLWEDGEAIGPKNREVGSRVMVLASKSFEKEDAGDQYRLVDEWINRTFGELEP